MLAFSSESVLGDGPEEHLPRCFKLADIELATNCFDEKLVIGTGGFGKVYKGLIDDHTSGFDKIYKDDHATVVAIKRLNPESKQGSDEFWTELNTLYNVRHANLVTLLGHVNSYNEMILVYEYMPNGMLANHLYESSNDGSEFSPLVWGKRLDICLDVARGLEYLHLGNNYVHRDVKTTNILLDKNWVAKISDFGLSKQNKNFYDTHISTKVKGTFGFLDPNYYLTGRLTNKSDVYAFGVVLLEVLCGRPAIDTRLEEQRIGLVQWVDLCVKEGKIACVIDSNLDGQIFPRCLKLFVQTAIDCLHNHPYARPSMENVVKSLEQARALQQEGTRHQDGRKLGMLEKVFRRIRDQNKNV